MTTASRALHTALYGRIATTLGYTTFTGLVPQGQAPPYVVLLSGPEARSDEGSDRNGTASRTSYSFRVDDRSPLTALDRAKAIVDSLTTTYPTVTGHRVLLVNLVSMVPVPALDPVKGDLYGHAATLLFITVPAA